MASGSTFSVIGADVTIKGDISATADLHIDGTIEGDIACAALVQGEKSSIQGAVSAESARLAGCCHQARWSVVTRRLRIEVLGGFQPQGVYDAEAAGEQYAENPGEVPHGRSPQ